MTARLCRLLPQGRKNSCYRTLIMRIRTNSCVLSVLSSLRLKAAEPSDGNSFLCNKRTVPSMLYGFTYKIISKLTFYMFSNIVGYPRSHRSRQRHGSCRGRCRDHGCRRLRRRSGSGRWGWAGRYPHTSRTHGHP